MPVLFYAVLLSGLLCLVLPVPPGAAQTPEPAAPAGLQADHLLLFADRLMAEGEYFRAMTEYRRFLAAYPEDPRRAMAHFRIGLALYQGQSYGEALLTFREVAGLYPDSSYGKQAWLWQGESLLRQGQYREAEHLYAEVVGRFPHEPLGPYAQYQRGWTLVYRRQWQAAAQAFGAIRPDSPLYEQAQRVAADVGAGERLPQQSPLLAGIMSAVLPGSGQLYNGRLGDALLAFVLNGLFLAGTLEALQQKAYPLAGVLGVLEAGWYLGNVYGAVNGAYKQNRFRQETFIHNLENRFRLEPPPQRPAQVFGLQLRIGF